MKQLKNRYQRILEYLKGNFSNKERHTLEKEALDDPFLQDALDGFEIIETDVLEKDIKKLSAQIQLRTEKRKRLIPLFYYPIAASLLLLIGFSLWWFNGYQSLEVPQEIVNSEIEEEPKQPQFVDRSQEVDITSKVAFEEIEDAKVVSSNKEAYQAVPKPPNNKEIVASIPKRDLKETPAEKPDFSDIEEEAADVPEIANELSSGVSSDLRIEKPQPLSSAKKAIDRSVASEAKAIEKIQSIENKPKLEQVVSDEKEEQEITDNDLVAVFGVVTDDNGGTLPGVNITVKGSALGTQSDFDGQYQLNVHKDAILLFNYVGFETEERIVDSAIINVELAEDLAVLNEIVVVGYGVKKKQDFKRIIRDRNTSPDVNAIPFNGTSTDFKEWIKQNLNPSIMNKLSEESTTVNISFVVSEFGNLYQVRFDTALDKTTKKELKSIIKSSPKWKPATLKGASVSEKVELKLVF